jgi:ABC-type proline/glycine betaine transport system substrate-binding protein
MINNISPSESLTQWAARVLSKKMGLEENYVKESMLPYLTSMSDNEVQNTLHVRT